MRPIKATKYRLSQTGHKWTALFKSRIKFTNLPSMFADLDFYDIYFKNFDPTASAYGWRLKFVRAEHSATAEGEKCCYGPTLGSKYL